MIKPTCGGSAEQPPENVIAEFRHRARGEEMVLATSIVTVTGEGYLQYGNRTLLYVEGSTTAGSACCGAVQCRLIRVPGFIISRHDRIDATSGDPVSTVEMITDPDTLKDVQKLFFRKFPSSLFVFA